MRSYFKGNPMALFRIDHTSECVKVSLPLYMIEPQPSISFLKMLLKVTNQWLHGL